MNTATIAARGRNPHCIRPALYPAWTVRAARLAGAAVLATFALAPGAGASQTQDAWRMSSEFSFVRTGGNAESSTLGIASTLTRSWELTEVKIEAGAIRTQSTRLSRTGVGTPSDFVIVERSESEISSESYHATLRVDRRFSDRTSVFVQSGWNRNTFAGILDRVVNVAGVSVRWTENERQNLRTAYGITHTVQHDVVRDPEAASRFLGLRVSSDYWRQVTGSTEWDSNLVVDGNGYDPSDLRADWTNSLSVAMNEHLGLKTSFRTAFDNRPALASVPLHSPGGEAAGAVLLPHKKLDHVFTVALVVSF